MSSHGPLGVRSGGGLQKNFLPFDSIFLGSTFWFTFSLGAASCEHGNRYDGEGLSFFKNSSGRNSNIWIYNRLNLIDLSERRSYLSSPIGRSDRKKI